MTLGGRRVGEPSLENLIATIWELAEHARKPWRPPPPEGEAGGEPEIEERTHDRREYWFGIALVILIVLLVLWSRHWELAPALIAVRALGSGANDQLQPAM